MKEWDVPLVRESEFAAYLEWVMYRNGDGPEVPEPERKSSPTIVQIYASNKGEAAIIAERLYPDCLAARFGIKRHAAQ